MLTEARRDKERKYVELLQSDRCQLVVVGVETGGRWSPEAVRFFERFGCIASTRSTCGTPFLVLPGMAEEVVRMLSVSCCRAFCGSLISSSEDPMRGIDGAVPDLADLFSAC